MTVAFTATAPAAQMLTALLAGKPFGENGELVLWATPEGLSVRHVAPDSTKLLTIDWPACAFERYELELGKAHGVALAVPFGERAHGLKKLKALVRKNDEARITLWYRGRGAGTFRAEFVRTSHGAEESYVCVIGNCVPGVQRDGEVVDAHGDSIFVPMDVHGQYSAVAVARGVSTLDFARDVSVISSLCSALCVGFDEEGVHIVGMNLGDSDVSMARMHYRNVDVLGSPTRTHATTASFVALVRFRYLADMCSRNTISLHALNYGGERHLCVEFGDMRSFSVRYYFATNCAFEPEFERPCERADVDPS